MRFFQLSFLLSWVAIVCALPLGKPEPHKSLVARGFGPVWNGIKAYAPWIIGPGLIQGIMDTSGGAACLGINNVKKWRGRWTDEDETQAALFGECPQGVNSFQIF